ncbi:MAG: twitching motility protein PilT [Cytophagaceae bacterium SCN 52-12]|nr:MAG: twitching motility protein PilT [Cytophagaceae bacterium SCN 52-12]
MTGSEILLDTNVIIELFKGNPTILENLKGFQSVNISSTVLGELLLGAYRSSDPEKHLAQINGFLLKCQVLAVTAQTANEYGRIKSALLTKGKPIPENDIWIAAVTKYHNLTLISADKHFNEVEMLKVERW